MISLTKEKTASQMICRPANLSTGARVCRATLPISIALNQVARMEHAAMHWQLLCAYRCDVHTTDGWHSSSSWAQEGLCGGHSHRVGEFVELDVGVPAHDDADQHQEYAEGQSWLQDQGDGASCLRANVCQYQCRFWQSV